MNSSIDIAALPMWVLVVGGIFGIAQLTFEIWVFVKMLKTPAEQLTLGGRKWLWGIIILFVNWIGAIIFLAAGRKPAVYVEVAPPVAAAAVRAETAADALYGARKDESGR